MDEIKLLYIDLFCGAGGTSTGVENAMFDKKKCAKVIACVNHDKNAIASHAANHPEALHFTEDIRILNLTPLVEHVKKYRILYPAAKVVLWASLECTNFSKAKGGLSRDADSRTLAEHLFCYIEAISPEYIQIENVEEFMSWGDMDENGHPISREKGKRYLQWVRNVKKYGYTFDYRILNAANYGAYTSRKRFFGIFARNGFPIAFPNPTHCKEGSNGLFGTLQKWNPIKDVLNFNDEGNSIFTRKKPLSEKTLERIYAGLIKFVAGEKETFLIKYNSMSQNGKYIAPGVDQPCPVISCQNRLGLVSASFLSKQFSGNPESKNISVDSPAGSITTVDHHAFISAYYGNGRNISSIENPSPVVTTKDRISIVSAFIMNQYSGNGAVSDINKPSPAVMTNPKQNLISYFLMNPQYANNGNSVEKPCFTLIARMDKMPPYLVQTEAGEMAIRIYDNDSQMTKKIKEFMALYGIIDIKMRMLKIPELKKIMGFSEDYTLIGTQAEQKKYIGNAVEVNMARVLCEALVKQISSINRKTA